MPAPIRWNRDLAGAICPVCNGTGSSFEHGDAHRSPGTIPCPQRGFQGHGFLTCINGNLQFSDYDLKNWKSLKRKYPK